MSELTLDALSSADKRKLPIYAVPLIRDKSTVELDRLRGAVRARMILAGIKTIDRRGKK